MADIHIDLGNIRGLKGDTGPAGAPGQDGQDGAPGQDGHTPTEAEIRAAFGTVSEAQTISEDTTISVTPNTVYDIIATVNVNVTLALPSAGVADGDYTFLRLAGAGNEVTPTLIISGSSTQIKGDTTATWFKFVHALYLHGTWLVAIN